MRGRKERARKNADDHQDMIDLMEIADMITRLKLEKMREDFEKTRQYQKLTMEAQQRTISNQKRLGKELKALKDSLFGKIIKARVYDGADLSLI